ncbi:hypothetical protein M0R45_007096 [Rubus argutus]|uniref:Uncharacterized protein n=1 Tax=Rubus argutus TaxID=59490 RepID=A0AAW1YSH2_RUBAR
MAFLGPLVYCAQISKSQAEWLEDMGNKRTRLDPDCTGVKEDMGNVVVSTLNNSHGLDRSVYLDLEYANGTTF